MTPETERRAVAFIRTIASRCSNCTHRREEICRGCPSRWANEIMRDYEAEMKPAPVDYSLAARKIRILDALHKAGRPLRYSQIDVSDVCSDNLKKWTLRRMVECRLISRIRHDDPSNRRIHYLYTLPHKSQTPNRSKHGNENTSTDHGAK